MRFCSQHPSIYILLLALSALPSLVQCNTVAEDLYHNYYDPDPSPEDGPAFSAGALRNPKYLPIQIASIVSAYAFSLVIVALTLLALSKKRRAHLTASDEEEVEFNLEEYEEPHFEDFTPASFPVEKLGQQQPQLTIPNFSLKSPVRSEFNQSVSFAQSPVSATSTTAPGVDFNVDQTLVAETRAMSQQQLEAMYKHVMEHEEAKEQGIVLDSPVYATGSRQSTGADSQTTMLSSKREKNRPSGLNLNQTKEEKHQSKASSFLSALRSPRKKNIKALQISSPIMTPETATFPHHEWQDTNAKSPRHYKPQPLALRSTDFAAADFDDTQNKAVGVAVPMTPDLSPESSLSIDERLSTQLPRISVNRIASRVPSEYEPPSATSQRSHAMPVGLPSSPKPGATFPTLPSSPKPGATFQRANAPSAVRTGGALPLRAYEPALNSPTTIAQTTKQTVFERRGPLSPGGGRTPMTAGAVPYSPYQPFTPCVPITPSLVTKEDRKRMKRMVPKTPTLQMVQNSDEMW